MSAVLPLLLAVALQAPAQLPDLQVEVKAADGAPTQQLARAVNRALLTLGARVILGARTDEPCERCVLLTVHELAPGRYRLEARQGGRTRTEALEVDPTAGELERARAIAIQARLFVGAEGFGEAASPAAACAPPPAGKPPVPSVARAARPAPIAPAPAAPPSAPEPAAVAPAAPAELNAQTAPPEPAPASVDPAPAEPEKVAAAEPPAPLPPDVPAVRVPIVPRGPAVPLEVVDESGHGPWPWVAGLAGLGAGLAAGGCALAARDHYRALSDQTIPVQEALAHRDDGKVLQNVSLALSAVALGGLATGALLYFRAPGQQQVSVAVAPAAGGLVLGVEGSLP